MSDIVLKSTQFRREREPSWRELETLVAQVEKRGIRSLAPEQLMRLTNLYRATLSSLSVARAISLDHNLVTYLEGLAGRAYFCVYGTRARVGGVVSSFFLERLPRLVASIRWHLLIAAAFLALGVAAGWMLVLDDPERYYLLVPDGVSQGRSPATPTDDLRDVLYDRPDENLGDALQVFASFLFTHNAVTGIFAFGLGFALGLPTLALLIYNGVLIGALAALYQIRGLGIDFWGWILPHGVTELLAIVLCGAGGAGDDTEVAAWKPKEATAIIAAIVWELLTLGRRGKRKPDPDKPPPKPLPPELVIDLAARKFRESGDTKVILQPSDFGKYTDDEAAVRGFIDAHRSGRLVPSGQHVAQLDLGELNAEFVERVKKDTGIDLTGYRQAIDTGQINKIFKKHGEGTETDEKQVPVTSETMSLYLRVIENYDTVSVRGKDSGDTFTFSKKVDGVIVVIEQMREKAGEFALFNMWIKKVSK